MPNIECFVCGKIHNGDCVLDDEYWANAERRLIEHEKRNLCELCGKFSPKSEIHNECHLQANM